MNDVAPHASPPYEPGVLGLRVAVALVAFLTLVMIWACVNHFPELMEQFHYPTAKRFSAPFGPHPAFLLTLFTACLLVAVGLIWVTPTSRVAGWLALTLALTTCGYVGIYFLTLLPKTLDPIIGDIARWWKATAATSVKPIGIFFLRSNLVASGYLPWLGAWTLSGGTQLIFLRSFIARAAGAEMRRELGNDLAMVLACWGMLAATLQYALNTLPTWVRVVGALLAAIGIGFWLMNRRARREGAWLCLGFALVLLAHCTLLFTPQLQPALAGICLLIVTLRFERIHTPLLFVPAVVAAASYFTVWRVSSASVILAALFWVACGLLAGFLCVIRRVRHLRPEGRGQALVLLTGFLVASLLGMIYVAVLLSGSVCTIDSRSAICWMHWHQDWWLILPLLTLGVFSVFAVFFKGQIDASVLFRRATVYAALTVLAIFAFGVLETTASELLSAGFPRGTPPAVAAGAVAVVIYPVKKRFDWVVERLLAALLRA